MTDQQTRTLADYPVGSRWLDSRGGVIVLTGADGDPYYPLEGFWEVLTRTQGTWALSEAATWTRIDAPAPDALREAAEQAKDFINLYRDRLPTALLGRVYGALEAALAQPAPASERDNGTAQRYFAEHLRWEKPELPPLSAARIPIVAPEPTPPAFDERRWQAALAALTGLLAHHGNEGADEAARYAVQHADSLLAAMEADRGQ